MGGMKSAIEDGKDAKKRFKSAPSFAPAGQSTQMIVGADARNDGDIVAPASTLYDRFALRRVYYSAFSPIPDASAVLPLQRPPLDARASALPVRLADALLRLQAGRSGRCAGADGMLPLDIDPKLAWALKHRGTSPST
jgi:predicted DNA-binding helix-hairpin-helix protein